MDEALEKEVDARSGEEEVEGENGRGATNAKAISGFGSSSSSSSDSEDDDGGEELRLEALEKSLAENPADYDAHVQYIQCLRKLGHIEKLTQARKAMNEFFPLSPNMWKEWAKDEASVNNGLEAFSTIEEIYEKGVHEYLSVPLWCEYINFVQEHDQLVAQCAPFGVSKIRDLFERALTAAGLHIAEGHMVWDAYREFEQAIYLTIDEENSEEKSKQINRIRAVFHRQLAVPLAEMRLTLTSYRHWEAEQGGNISDMDSDELAAVPAAVASAYRKAMEMYSVRVPFEDELLKQDVSDAKLQSFMNYIKFEESSGDPARVQILYERALSDFPVSSEIWLAYTSYLDKTLKVPHVLRDVYSRATRNCSWIGELWVRYLLSLERVHASEEELCLVFEKSLQCVFSSIDEYLELFLTRIDGLRRRISLPSRTEEGLEYGLIRDTFQRAAEYLSPDLAKAETILHLHAYWARLEANLGKDLVAARGVWESLLKKSGPMVEVWQAYIDMETAMGNINEARSIYKRCYSKRFTGTGSEDICNSWLRFEREFGSLDDLDIATRKVMPRLKELSIFRAQQESRNAASLTAEKDTPLSKDVPQKRKMTKISSGRHPPAKRQKGAGGEQGLGNATIELVDVHDTGKGKSSDVSTSDVAAIDKKIHENIIEDTTSRETKRREVDQNMYTDQCTAFVSNLSLEANEEHLRKFFSGCGVTAIRLLRDKFTGRSRGLAYVDFLDQEHLSDVTKKNKEKLLGQRLSIARSEPKARQKHAPARGRGGRTQFKREGGESSSQILKDSGKAKQSKTGGTRSSMASLCRSAAFAAARSVASRSKAAVPMPLPSRRAAPLVARSIVAAVGSMESLMPLHSATASARLKSYIAVDSCSWSWLSQGLKEDF